MFPKIIERAKELDLEFKNNITYLNNIVEFFSEEGLEKYWYYYTDLIWGFTITIWNEKSYLVIERDEINQFTKSGSFRIYKLPKEKYKSYLNSGSLHNSEPIEEIYYEFEWFSN